MVLIPAVMRMAEMTDRSTDYPLGFSYNPSFFYSFNFFYRQNIDSIHVRAGTDTIFQFQGLPVLKDGNFIDSYQHQSDLLVKTAAFPPAIRGQ